LKASFLFQPIILNKLPVNERKFEFIEAVAPARLDLAGAW
jgi:hypothetical protein